MAGEVVGAWQAEYVAALGRHWPEEGLQADGTLQSVLPQYLLQVMRGGLLVAGSSASSGQLGLEG